MKKTRGAVRRSGFVLLTVVLVTAVLMISAMMFVIQLGTEGHVAKTDAYFKSALNLAESGLTNALMDISSGIGAETWAVRLHGGTYTLPVVVSSGVHGTYQVRVDVVGTVENPYEGDQYKYHGMVRLTSTGIVYPPSVSVVQMEAGSSNYSARRAISMSTIATWTISPEITTTDTSSDEYSIRYGIYTGANLRMWGASYEVDGDVFANGNIDVLKADTVVDPGLAFAAGTISGVPDLRSNPGVDPIPFPTINLDGTEPGKLGYRVLYDAYVTGKAPFDGTNGYPDTRITGNPLDASMVYRATRGIDTLLNKSIMWTDPSNSSRTLKVLPAGPISQEVASAMQNPQGVYLFDGAVSLPKKDVTAAWSGTVVINGDFSISSNITVGSGGTPMKLLVTGDITKDNGCSTINGLVYTNGTFSGDGTADLIGALMAKGSVDTNGTLHVQYNSDLGTVGGLVTTTTTTSPAYNKLDTFERPADGQRMWQEVTPEG